MTLQRKERRIYWSQRKPEEDPVGAAGRENKAGGGHNMSIVLEKKLGFGTMRLPLLDAEDPKSIDLETFQQMADLYLERGFC